MKKISGSLCSNKRKYEHAPKDHFRPKLELKKKRICLKCGKMFISTGHYNRICEKCGQINARMESSMYAVSGASSDQQEFFEGTITGLN